MKRLLVVLMLTLMSLNFVACAQKKDSKTRLTKGSGRQSAATPQELNSWGTLNSYSEETELFSSNPDASARAFINNDPVFVGASQVNSIAMRLVFVNGQLNTQNSMLGLRFYDSSDPIAYLLARSNGRGATEGYRKANGEVRVVFADINEDGENLGNVIVTGVINGSRFNGEVFYGDGAKLGDFNVSTAYAIFQN